MPVADVARRMLDAHPRDLDLDRDLLVRCIEACADCAQACTQCADACLSEDDVQAMAGCIRGDLDCADVCTTTGRMLSRRTEADADLTRALVAACVQACKRCGDECEEHGRHGMEHCAVCAEQCRRCEQACRELLASIGG